MGNSSSNFKLNSLALIFSVLVHLVILYFLPKESNHKELKTYISVALFEDKDLGVQKKLKQEKEQEKKHLNQIVSKSEAKITEEEKDFSFLSEKTKSTDKQTIKRGDGENGRKTKKENNTKTANNSKDLRELKTKVVSRKSPSEENKNTVKAVTNNSDADKSKKTNPDKSLFLPRSALLDSELLKEKHSSSDKNTPSDKDSEQGQNSQPVSSASGSLAKELLNSSGSNDHLPQIQDGELTLLNTKASRYATFVRRVASQVFSQLRQKIWNEISSNGLLKAKKKINYEVVMSKDGSFLRAELKSSSSSSSFDQALLESVRVGVWDRNPPESALYRDGNFHFVFEAQVFTEPGVTGRKILILGTGLL